MRSFEQIGFTLAFSNAEFSCCQQEIPAKPSKQLFVGKVALIEDRHSKWIAEKNVKRE